MKHRTLLGVLFTSSLVMVGCTSESQTDDGLGGSGGGDVDVDVDGDGVVDPQGDLTANGSVSLAGTAIFAGLEGHCVDLAADFDARVDGEVSYSAADRSWTLSAMNHDSLSVTTSSGCATNNIEVSAAVSGQVDLAIAATAPSCNLFCDAHATATASAACEASTNKVECEAEAYAEADLACTATCETGGAHIEATAKLDASVGVKLDTSYLDAMVGQELDVSYGNLVDANGNIVKL